VVWLRFNPERYGLLYKLWVPLTASRLLLGLNLNSLHGLITLIDLCEAAN
jgi:hypothetical protein